MDPEQGIELNPVKMSGLNGRRAQATVAEQSKEGKNAGRHGKEAMFGRRNQPGDDHDGNDLAAQPDPLSDQGGSIAPTGPIEHVMGLSC